MKTPSSANQPKHKIQLSYFCVNCFGVRHWACYSQIIYFWREKYMFLSVDIMFGNILIYQNNNNNNWQGSSLNKAKRNKQNYMYGK